MVFARIGNVTKAAVRQFFHDDATTLAAALAFYAILSLAPVLVIVIWLAGLIWGGSITEEFLARVREAVGPAGAEVVATVLRNARQAESGTLAWGLGLAVLVFSATGVFAQLQHSLNRIWDVPARSGLGPWGWVRKRVLSLLMVLAIGVLLWASLILSAVLTALAGYVGQQIANIAAFWRVVDFVASLLVYVLLFAAMYKILPDARIRWPDVWFGAAVTAALFAVGKFAIGLYLGRSSYRSVYGAAGSLVVLLVWVYYSSLILFFGAQLSRARARQRAGAIPADRAGCRPLSNEQHQSAGPFPAG